MENVAVRLVRKLNDEGFTTLEQAAEKGEAFWKKRLRKNLLRELKRCCDAAGIQLEPESDGNPPSDPPSIGNASR